MGPAVSNARLYDLVKNPDGTVDAAELRVILKAVRSNAEVMCLRRS